VIEGLGHGHQDVAAPEAAGAVLRREGERVVANASLVQFNEITPENEGSFHFHGEASAFPLTAVLAVPHDERSAALLRGRYLGADEPTQIVRPSEVMDDLLETVFAVQRYVVAALVFVGASTLTVTALVFLLSAQLRRREIETMGKIGVTRGTIAAVLGAEVGLVVLMSLAVAGLLTLALARWGDALMRGLLLA
jgi:putative ABC transport system permease protein